MYRNKKITLKVLLSFVSALPLAGASTMLVKPTVSVANVTGMAAASIAVAKLIEYLQPPGLAALVVDYCRPNIGLSFEITPEQATTKTSAGKTYEHKGWHLASKCPKPFVCVSKPNSENGIQFFVSYCNDTTLHHKFRRYACLVTDDSQMDIITGSTVFQSQAPPFSRSLQWNNVPLQCINCTTSKSCDVEIVDYDPVVNGGSKVVGCVYDTHEAQEFVIWKALDKALSAPLPPISDSSSSNSSTPQQKNIQRKKSTSTGCCCLL